MTDLTEPQTRALAVLAAHSDGLTPSQFGVRLWPRHGDDPPSGLNRKAGQFLHVLLRKGLVQRYTPTHGAYYIYSTRGNPMTDYTKPHAFEPDDPMGLYCKCTLLRDNVLHDVPRSDHEARATTGFRHGETYDVGVDYDRLNAQSRRVYRVMADHEWRTLNEIAAVTGDRDASISARLRDFRKDDFGAMNVERRRRAGAGSGTFEYRCPDIPAPPADDNPLHRTVLAEGDRFALARAEGWQAAHDEFCATYKVHGSCSHDNPYTTPQ